MRDASCGNSDQFVVLRLRVRRSGFDGRTDALHDGEVVGEIVDGVEGGG